MVAPVAAARRVQSEFQESLPFFGPSMGFIPAGQYGGPPESGGPAVGNSTLSLQRLRLVIEGDAEFQPWRPGPGEKSFKWEDTPAQPVADNPNLTSPKYDLPSMEEMESFKGYEDTSYANATLVPPDDPSPTPTGSPPDTSFDLAACRSAQECKEALVAWAGDNFFYGTECAEEMTIQLVLPSRDLHYTLETFTERRETIRTFEPYKGEVVDGPWNGAPPLPWDIPCQAERWFANHTRKIQVPHTACVTNCHTCDQRGFNRCYRCQGLGWVKCSHCGGEGRTRNHESVSVPCTWCGSDGRRECHTCTGDGRIVCETCDGHRQLRHFIQLTVTFHNHKEDFMLESKELPSELVKELRGVTILEQTADFVWPILSYPVSEINQNSQRMLEKHHTNFPNEQRLLQRQVLTGLPVTECKYIWKDVKTRSFWVYGTERKCLVPDYPQKRCWGCSIS